MRRMRFISWMFVSLVLMLAFIGPYGFSIETSVEDAVLKGNWKEVIEILEKDEAKVKDPVARLIMGHANLAINRNNASMLLFLSAKEEGDLKLWSKWTDSFLHCNPQNSVAFYLSADAQARIGRLKEAVEGFDQALKMQEEFALALNARGVVCMLTNEWNRALIDFKRATELSPQLADAYASLGSYWIMQGAPEGALEAFNYALTINPNFALAYNGRGCAYFGLGNFDEANEDFTTASNFPLISLIAEVNRGLNQAYASDLVAFAALPEPKKPGMTIEGRSHEFRQRQIKNLTDWIGSKELLNTNWANTPPEKISSLAEKYGSGPVKMAMALEMDKLRSNLRNYSQQIHHYSLKFGTPDAGRLAKLHVISDFTTFAGNNLVPRYTGKMSWSQYDFVQDLKAIGKGYISYLKGVIPGSELTAPFKGEALGHRLGRVIEKGLSGEISPERMATEYVLEFWRTLVPIVGEPAYQKYMRSHYGMVSGALESVDIQSRMNSLHYIPPLQRQQLIKPQPFQKPTSLLYTTDQPLTHLGKLVHKLDTEIPSLAQQPRQLSIVGDDNFRSNLLQQHLITRGFNPRLIRPDENIGKKINQWPTQAIVGVKGTPGIPQIWNNLKFKPFTPSFPKGAPGGITMDMSKAFVDRGNWPVITSFGLLYKADFNIETKNGEDKK